MVVEVVYRIDQGSSPPSDPWLEMDQNESEQGTKTAGSSDWALLCEDLPGARRPSGALTLSRDHVVPRSLRRQQLWPNGMTVPSREEVRNRVIGMEPRAPGPLCGQAS